MRQLGAEPYAFDLAQARAFVAALTNNPDTTAVLQFADDTATKRKELARVHVGSITALADIIGKLNRARAAVWLQVNSGRRGNKNVNQVRACFIDDDGHGPLPPMLRLPPSIVVASSSSPRNRHYYWLLTDGQPTEKWSHVQRHLAAYYNTDKSVHNLDRVMRLPGTWNMHGPCEESACAKCTEYRRRTEPEPVRLLETHPERRYTFEQILAAHPLPEADRAAALASSAPSEAPTDAARLMAKRIGYWLATHEIEHDTQGPTTFRLKRCVFNPAHIDKLMIRVQSRGGIWAGCWHNSCGGNVNRWSAVKDRIGGWGQDGAPFSRGDDVEIAQRLLADITGNSEEALVGDLGQLWKYQGENGLWTILDQSGLSQAIAGYAGASVGKKALKINAGTIRGAVEVAKQLAAQPYFFGEAPPGVAFKNGVLMATPAGAAFVPHASENRLILGLPFDYVAGAPCDRWKKYLADCFEDDDDAAEKIDLLQEFLGVCLIGIATRYQKALLLYGPNGDNGKSVFAHVASELFPKETRRSVKPQDFGQAYYAAELATARINIVSEMPETDILSGDTFKAMITGDALMGRVPTQSPFQFSPVAGHIFACNRLPGTSDHTNGFWRRFVIIEWNRSFPVGHPLRDSSLKELIARSEMPGIAAWAVDGASRALARDALTVPASHERIMRGWRTETDAVAAFLHDCCEPTTEAQPVRELYQYFKLWCVDSGRKVIADSTMGRRLRENKIQFTTLNGYSCYFVRVRPTVAQRWVGGYLLG